MHRKLALVFPLLLAVCLGKEASAQQQTNSAGYHRHDGFFLRFTPGFTTAATATTEGADEVSVAGGGLSGSLAIGGALREDLVLCAELSSFGIWAPTVAVNERGSVRSETAWGMEYLGIGVSWYLPGNLYLHGGLGGAEMAFSNAFSSSLIKAGPAAKLMLGKEWWVSGNWGLGLAGHLMLASMPDERDAWSLAALGLAFSATYN